MSTQDHTTKRCPKCQRVLPLTSEYWHKWRYSKSGFVSYCKECRKIMKKADYDRDRNKILAQKKIYHIEHREQRAVYHKKYRKENHEELIAKKRQYHAENRDEISKKQREKRKLKADKINDKIREWAKANPDKVREKWVRRRARKKNATGGHTSEEVKMLYEQQNGLCFHCGVALNGKFQEDHWIPLTRIGTSDNISNIRLMCQKCNGSKCDKLPWEWCPEKYSKPYDYPK